MKVSSHNHAPITLPPVKLLLVSFNRLTPIGGVQAADKYLVTGKESICDL